MTRLEGLRLAVALVHSAPGAELRLRTADGTELLVSERPTADIGPCGMRRVVAACSCAPGPNHSRLITDIEIGGWLQHLGGGVPRLARAGELRHLAHLDEVAARAAAVVFTDELVRSTT